MILFGIITGLITFVAGLGLAIYVFLKNPKSRVNQTFGLFNLEVGFWGLFYAIWHLLGIATGNPVKVIFWGEILAYFYIPLSVMFYHFVLYYTNALSQKKKSLIFGYFFIIVSLFVVHASNFIAGTSSRWYINLWTDPGLFFYFYIIIWLAYMVYSLYLLFVDYKKSTGLRKKQSQYLFWGMATGYSLAITIYMSWFPVLKIIPPFGSITIFIAIIFSGYSIVRYRLFDIYFVVGKTVVYFFSILSVYAISLTLFVAEYFLVQNTRLNIVIHTLSLMPIILLYQKVFYFYEKIAGKYFYYSIYNVRKTLSEIGGRLAQITSFIEFKNAMFEILQSSFQARTIEIELVQKNSLVYDYFVNNQQILVRSEIPFLINNNVDSVAKNMLVEVEKAMIKNGVEIHLPLVSQEEIIGLVSIGEKISKTIYSEEEIRLLANFSYQASVVLKNVILFEQLRNINISLEEKVKDRTRNLESEKNKISAIVTNLTDGLLVFGPDGKVLLMNPQAEILLGIKEKDILGKALFAESKTAPVCQTFLCEPLADIFKKEGMAIFRKEVRVKENLVLEVSTASVGISENERGILVIMHDITREKFIEKMKTEFVSLAAHQLRTPLTAVKWSLSMLLDGDLGKMADNQTKMLKKTYDGNQRMVDLINDLLDVTRIEEGRYLFDLVPVNLEDTIKAVINIHKDKITERKINFVFNSPETQIPKLVLDKEKISLAIENLIDNALKYTPIGGKVEVFIKSDKMNIEVCVKDNGAGIPEQQQDRIFSKFFRGTNSVKMETDGTGLGLYIVKNIIEAHGGKIWFESKEKEGTAFHFTIPIKK